MISISRMAAGLFGALLLAVPQSCSHNEDTEFKIEIARSEAESTAGSQWVTVTAASGKEWTLSLSDESGATIDWIAADPAQGKGSSASASVSWTANTSAESRTAVIRGVCGGLASTATFTQKGASAQPDPVDPDLPDTPIADNVPGWMELPATDNSGLYFISHASTTASGAGRNYSFYWDSKALVAHWVAYPLNKGCIASGSRTNAWGLDPKLPESAQPVLYKGFSNGGSYGNSDGGRQSYQRGHQCPSADRLSKDDNEMTFYGTNMTPQKGELNENIWAALETRVRDWSKAFDTLYVATGCVVEGSTEYAYDNVGKKVTVPVAYYKALLGYSKAGSRGISSQTKGYTGVAFYFEHRGYSDNNYMNCAMTIDALEEKVGENFFVNLPAAIGDTMADKVEATRDDYWWNGQ